MNTNTEEIIARRVGFFTLILGLMVLATSFLSSCNTTRGFGRDVQRAGDRIEEGATRVQRRIS
ncbi:MAG TPA: entericidin A/B family lipoprotein [Prosthecobacter sp.]|nr:entericidin A/B family lipoprotein [Prosthecobacter sp.]